MNNLFFYTRKDGDKTYTESFNLNKLVRSVQMEDGTLLILLDDLHERSRDVQAPNIKTNKLEVKRVRETFQSEIYLEGEDITRFNNLANN
jgi:hypothetical protein